MNEVNTVERPVMPCHCLRCDKEVWEAIPNKTRMQQLLTPDATRMYVCEVCGCKRCPHSDDHRNACTGSNEPGQPGSRYPARHNAAEAERLADQLTGESPYYEAAALLRQQAAELKRLHDYDTRLTAVMPADFKDWHENSRNEWPEIAAGVITSLREREADAWKEVERLSTLADKWNDECDEFREDNKRLASERDKANTLLRQALEALAKYTTPGVLGGRVPIDAELVAAIKQHLGGRHGN